MSPDAAARIPKSLLMVGIADLALAFGRSQWAIRHWVRLGRFPKPIPLGGHGSPAWRLSTVEAWLEKQQARRHKPIYRGRVLQQMQRRGGDDDD